MDYKPNRLLGMAAVLSAAVLYFADGLHPVWWLMWLAPLPILWMAPRVKATPAFAASMIAWFAGHLSMWSYYHTTLHIPAPIILAALGVPSVIFGFAILLYRGFVRRDQALLAMFSLPTVWAFYEFVNNLLNGTYTSIAYTQMDCLPLIQLASVTGIWGISFIVMLIPAAILIATLNRRIALTAAAVIALVIAGGFFRLLFGESLPPQLRVGFTVSDLNSNLLPETPADSTRLLTEYTEQVRTLAAAEAEIIILPEMTAVVFDTNIPALDRLYTETARSTGARILVPIIHGSPTQRFNEARLYSPNGTLEAVYRKHHLVPVFEDRTTPGRELVILHQPNATIGIEICKDLDYIPLSRRYGKEGTGLLLVPAFDFVVDDWLHSRMAIMRGVEHGFNIARVAKTGLITVSDTRGWVREQQASNAAPFSTLVSSVPANHIDTLYSSWGDWFAYLNGAFTLLILGYALKRSRKINGPPAPSS